ncbi:snf7 family protein [Stylonychia lemnae]|uniref:Snf7 family protein n=1 Tax=Stylonychia lemnae TaxID=5949 RepID=A0A077ZQR3_STYLE|nr:snf7 family protein [Stylonychia lemnae]|eukprot:CDW72242.1 snf7 family protein [Stylonychia lemnae]
MGNTQKKPDLLDVAMDLKMTARSLEKQSQKVEQLEKAERKKILDAMNKNNMESAKIFAENVIRNRKEALNLKRFGIKMGALAAKLESAYRTQQISETISKTVPMLHNCMKKMDTLGIGASISEFENVFESLDVKTEELNGALENVYATTIDQGEVNSLLQEMKEAHGIEVGSGLQNANSNGIQNSNAQVNDIDEMQKKLDQLKHM